MSEIDTDNPAAAPRFALQEFLGMSLTGETSGAGTASLNVTEAHHNPNGVVHGAVLFALADTAMGKATMSVVDPGLYCASIEISLRFIRASAGGQLVAEATVVRRGRHVVHLEARVNDEDGLLIATAAGTFAILGG